MKKHYMRVEIPTNRMEWDWGEEQDTAKYDYDVVFSEIVELNTQLYLVQFRTYTEDQWGSRAFTDYTHQEAIDAYRLHLADKQCRTKLLDLEKLLEEYDG